MSMYTYSVDNVNTVPTNVSKMTMQTASLINQIWKTNQNSIALKCTQPIAHNYHYTYFPPWTRSSNEQRLLKICPPLVLWPSMRVFVSEWEWAILSLTDDRSCLHSRLLRTWRPTWSGCQQLPLRAPDGPWQSEKRPPFPRSRPPPVRGGLVRIIESWD